jgi:cystathionine beta-lyase
MKRSDRESDLESQLIKAKRDKDKAIRLVILLIGKDKVAEFLKNHHKIQSVIYPGFHSFKGYETMKKNCNQNFTGGGMISFYIDTNFSGAAKFLGNLKVIQLAESLGGIESLVCIPARMTHASIPKELREKNGIPDTLIRLSVGIENIDDLIVDINEALKFC